MQNHSNCPPKCLNACLAITKAGIYFSAGNFEHKGARSAKKGWRLAILVLGHAITSSKSADGADSGGVQCLVFSEGLGDKIRVKNARCHFLRFTSVWDTFWIQFWLPNQVLVPCRGKRLASTLYMTYMYMYMYQSYGPIPSRFVIPTAPSHPHWLK